MELLHSFLSEQMVERIGWVLVHFLWQGVAVAALVWCVLKAFGRASSDTRYVAACMGLILMAAAPVVTFMVLGEGVEVAASDEPMPVATTPAVAVQAPIETKTVVMAEMEPMVLPEPSFWEVLTARLEAALPYCVPGWFAGVAMLSVWYLGGWCQLQKLRRIGTKAVSEVISEKTSQLANRLDIKRAVRIVESALVQVPTVIGWLRPMVLLPATALTGLDEMQLTAMIAHELAHIRRCDYLINIAQTVVEILGFYHPAVWWASRQIRIERENCCDDMAVALVQNRKDYAGALFTMEAIRSKQLDLAVAANGGHLQNRISRLAGKSNQHQKSGWIPSVITILLVTGLLITTSMTMQSCVQQKDVQSDLKKIDYSCVTVKEGVGFNDIIVGDKNCTREFIVSRLGTPKENLKDTETHGWWLNYRNTYGIDFWLNENDVLKEIRLNEGFKGKLQSGISISSDKYDVFRIYGNPIEEKRVDNLNERVGTKLVYGQDQILYRKNNSSEQNISKIYYHKHNILFWFSGSKIEQFVVFPKTENQEFKTTLPDGATVEQVQGWVEDFFKHNYRDITARKTLEWGEPVMHDDGTISMRYKYEATIWDKDKVIENKIWTFDKDGKFLHVRKVGAENIYSLAGAQALVEDFFANNYRDVTARKTLEWGEPVRYENGNVSIQYSYEATIWDKDKIVQNKVWTFDKNGKFISVEDAAQDSELGNDSSNSSPPASDKEPNAGSQETEEKSVFGPVKEAFLSWAADEKSTIDFDTETVYFGTGTENMEQFNAWLTSTGIDALSMNTGIHGLCGFEMVVVPVENDMWDASPERAKQFLSAGKPGTPANISGKGDLPATYLFKTREGGMGILQILGFKENPDGGVRIRYKMIRDGDSPRPGGETEGSVLVDDGQLTNNEAAEASSGSAMIKQTLIGNWSGTAIDKPDEGSSLDTFEIQFVVNSQGQWAAVATGSFINGNKQIVGNLQIESDKVEFDILHRTGTRKKIQLVLNENQLIGEGIAVDSNEDSCFIVLKKKENVSIHPDGKTEVEVQSSVPGSQSSGDKAQWAVRDSGRAEGAGKSEVTIGAKVFTTGLTHEMIRDFLNNELGVDASLSPEGLLCSVELTDAQSSALGKWMVAAAGTSLLTSPSVRVFDGEESMIAVTDTKKFITGYEGNTPKVQEVTPGVQFEFTPHVVPDKSAVRLAFLFDKTTIIDVTKCTAADGKEIELPAVENTTVNTTVIIPAGKTKLVPVGAGTKTIGEKDEQERMILLIKTEVSEPSSVSAPPAMGGMSTPSRQEIAELLMGAWQALESGDSSKIDNYFYFENDAIKQRALPYLKPKLGDFSDYDDVHILDMTTLPDGSWEVFTLNPMPSSERCLIYSRLVVFADGRYKLKMCTQEYFDNRLDTTNLSPEQVGQIITEKALNKWKNATGQTLNELIQSEIQSLERALLAIQYAKVHHLKLVPLNAEEINKKIDKFRNTQPEKLKQEIIEKSSFTAENPLEIISAALEPIAQGKNTLYVTVKNNADNEQVFGVHIYTRSVDYGTQGVGWGIPFFETLQPGETKRARFVYKIQGPVTDNTYIRLKFYNPATEADYDYEQPFAERFYKGSDLQKRDVLKTLQRASEKQFAETSAALETVQNNIRNKQYEKAWSSFTEDYQRAEYQSRGFEAFKRQMEPEHELDSAFIWEKSDFLKLKPLKAFTDNGMLKLQAACEDAQWTVDFVKNVGVWKINWIAGYRPKVLDMQEADNEEAQQQKTTGENGKQEQTILLEMPGGFGGGLRPEEAIKFPKNWDETVAKYNKEHGIDPNEIRILEEVVPLDPNQLRTEVYDVADILHYPGTNRKPAEDIDALTQTIVQSIVLKSWSGNGGEGRIDHFRDDKLIIYQTPQVHEEIERYLKNLREELFKQVSIEARFLLVPDDFPKEFESSVDGQDIKLELPLSNQTAGQVVEGPANSEDVLAALEYEPEVKPGTVFDNFKKLDDLEVDFLRRAVQAHKNAKLLSAPKATVLNGEEACMQIQTERAYIGFDDETKYTNEGITLDMQPVMSADKRYVILKGSIQYSQVLESRSVEHGGKTYDIPTVQVVNLPVPRMNLEDKGTLLITGPDIKDPDNPNHEKQRLLILIKPTIIKQEEAEPELVK